MLSYAIPILQAKSFADTMTEYLVGEWLSKSFKPKEMFSCEFHKIDQVKCPLVEDNTIKPWFVLAYNPALRSVGHVKLAVRYA